MSKYDLLLLVFVCSQMCLQMSAARGGRLSLLPSKMAGLRTSCMLSLIALELTASAGITEILRPCMLHFVSSFAHVHTFVLSNMPSSTAEGISVKLYEEDQCYHLRVNTSFINNYFVIMIF